MVSNALYCAQAIIDALCKSASCQVSDWIGVGIGINTGPVYVGILGSKMFKDYTVVGNTVNIAARLCGSASKFQIFFTENTKKLVEGQGIQYRSIGKVPLKGIRSHLEVFELID